jgi:hypothetical protein
MPAPLPILQTLWNCDEAEARHIGPLSGGETKYGK